MQFIKTPLKGALLIEPRIFRDHRGLFMEVYNEQFFRENEIALNFVQDNYSQSVKGTLRGLHYQIDPYAQGKLVRVCSGEIFDVAVDIRKGSPDFGKWVGYRLSAENNRAIYIPPGFAHGFLVLSSSGAQVIYKCTQYYQPSCDRGILWSDPRINIQWPQQPDLKLISDKDKNAPPLDKAEINFLYQANA